MPDHMNLSLSNAIRRFISREKRWSMDQTDRTAHSLVKAADHLVDTLHGYMDAMPEPLPEHAMQHLYEYERVQQSLQDGRYHEPMDLARYLHEPAQQVLDGVAMPIQNGAFSAA